MKTAIENAKTKIAELWSSPSDAPTYTQIFEVLERAKKIEKQQIIDAHNSGQNIVIIDSDFTDAEKYYTSTFETKKL